MGFPSRREVFRVALGKAGMVKDDFGSSALLYELEFHYRIDTRIPVDHSPGLDDSRIRHKFDVSSQNDAAEKCERASHFSADFRRHLLERNTGILGCGDLRDLIEQFAISERLVDTTPARPENGFLMNGFRRAGNLLPGCRPDLS